MRKYTEFGTEVLQRLGEKCSKGKDSGVASVEGVRCNAQKKNVVVGEAGDVREQVSSVLYFYQDANCLPLAREKVSLLAGPGVMHGL